MEHRYERTPKRRPKEHHKFTLLFHKAYNVSLAIVIVTIIPLLLYTITEPMTVKTALTYSLGCGIVSFFVAYNILEIAYYLGYIPSSDSGQHEQQN